VASREPFEVGAPPGRDRIQDSEAGTGWPIGPVGGESGRDREGSDRGLTADGVGGMLSALAGREC
jgi:hypothetical protein